MTKHVGIVPCSFVICHFEKSSIWWDISAERCARRCLEFQPMDLERKSSVRDRIWKHCSEPERRFQRRLAEIEGAVPKLQASDHRERIHWLENPARRAVSSENRQREIGVSLISIKFKLSSR